MRGVGLRRSPTLGAVHWLRSSAVLFAALCACGLGINGLGDFADANVDADSAGGGSSGADGGTGGSSSGNDAPSGVTDCPAGLADQMTECTSSSRECAKGCGPELADGGVLGTSSCSCNTSTSVYNCTSCVYPAALPPCYALGDAPPTCPNRAASGVACAKACNEANPGATPPCAFVTGNGKVDGCQCIQKTGATKPVWTCAARW